MNYELKKFKMLFFLIFFFGIFGLAKSSLAATYYVDYGAADDTGAGTSGSPYKYCPGDERSTHTITNGANTFIFKGGVTYEPKSDTVRAYLIDVAYSGAAVGTERIYDGNSAGTFGTGKAVIDLQSLHYNAFYGVFKNYIKIINFEIYGMKNPLSSATVPSDGLCADGGKYRVYRAGSDQCVAYSGNGTTRTGAVFLMASNYWIINDNKIYNSQHYADSCVFSPETDGYASSISSVPSDQRGIFVNGTSGGATTNITINNNEIYNIGRDAITIVGSVSGGGVSGVTVTNNNIGGSGGQGYFSVALRIGGAVNNVNVSGNTIHDGWQYEGDDSQIRCHAGDVIHIYGDTDAILEATHDPNNIIIEKNYLYNDKVFFYANGTSNAFIEDDSYNITFRNNIIVNPHHFGISIQEAGTVNLFNNTIVAYNPAVAAVWTTSATNANTNVIIKNNILVHMASSLARVGLYIGSASTAVESDYNLFYKPNYAGDAGAIQYTTNSYTLAEWQAASVHDDNSINGNPVLAGLPAAGNQSTCGPASNYYIGASSTNAIDRGVDLSAVSSNVDYSGNSRGAVWDIGAYEYIFGSADITPPTAPSGLNVS